MQNDYEKFELAPEYAERINGLDTIRLAIVGKDPFPMGARAIPFVKDTWAALDDRSAGHHLFRSLLGMNVEQTYGTPQDAAHALLDGHLDGQRIVLLNASYSFLKGEKLSPQTHSALVSESLETNRPILAKTEYILLCGGAKRMMKWVMPLTDTAYAAPHPSLQSKNSLPAERRWEWNYWWEVGRLREWLQGPTKYY